MLRALIALLLPVILIQQVRAWPDMTIQEADIPADVRLCDAPLIRAGMDYSQVECRATLTVLPGIADLPAPTAPITVLAWNIERGRLWGQQLDLFGSQMPMPDVLMLSEVDRGCERSGRQDIARLYAERLQMKYVLYATEFLETRVNANGQREYACEHGNALLSRYPLTQAGAFFFRAKSNAYLIGGPSSEQRLGGRSAVKATVMLGQKRLQVFSTHLESFALFEQIRLGQAKELRERAAAVKASAIIGGDLNDFLYSLAGGRSPMQVGFAKSAYVDPHRGFSGRRFTIQDPAKLIIDFLYTRGVPTQSPGICPETACFPVSDHRAVWVRVTP